MPKVTDEHRAARREQILTAALRCVMREGFHKTTMADVIGEAGLSAGAVYGYFKSKAEIIRAIADVALGEVAHLLHELAERPEAVEPADAIAVMLAFITKMAEQPEGDFTKVGVQAWAEAVRDEEVHRIARDRMTMVRSAMAEVMRRAQTDGTLAADADPEQVAQVVFGLMPGFVVQRLIVGDVTAASYIEGFRSLAR